MDYRDPQFTSPGVPFIVSQYIPLNFTALRRVYVLILNTAIRYPIPFPMLQLVQGTVMGRNGLIILGEMLLSGHHQLHIIIFAYN